MNTFRYSSCVNQELAKNGRHTFAQSHALMLFSKASVYSFIPKNACSTLRYSLAIANGCLEQGGDINWIHKNNGVFQASLKDLFLAKCTFVVLRCPYRRLASTFLDKFIDKAGPAWFYYDLIDRQTSLDELTFEQFVNSLSRGNLASREMHWRPQVDFLLYNNYSYYFSVEKFDVAKDILEEEVGFKIYDARDLTKHGSDQYESIKSGRWSNVPIRELYKLKQSGQLPAPESLYSRDLHKLVGSIYKDDLELYSNYCGAEHILDLTV